MLFLKRVQPFGKQVVPYLLILHTGTVSIFSHRNYLPNVIDSDFDHSINFS